MIEIRQLSTDEVKRYNEELMNFMYMILSENGKEIDFKGLSQKYYNDMVIFSEDGSAVLIGGFDGERLVGFLWGYERIFLGKRVMHNNFVAIDSRYRGKGIGSRFYRKFEEIAREREIKTLEAMCSVNNSASVNYHLHNGFEIERYRFVKQI